MHSESHHHHVEDRPITRDNPTKKVWIGTLAKNDPITDKVVYFQVVVWAKNQRAALKTLRESGHPLSMSSFVSLFKRSFGENVRDLVRTPEGIYIETETEIEQQHFAASASQK
jgi:hypothetical protein